MSQMQPSLRCFNRRWSLTVFHLHDCVIVARIDDNLLLYLGMGDILAESPPYATTAAGVDESVLRPRIERILSVDKFRVQHHIPLLTIGFEVWQTFPCFQVFGPCYCSSCCCCAKIVRLCGVVPFSTEHTINPAVFMLGDAHIIDVYGRVVGIRHSDGFFPKSPFINTIGRLGHSEERFPVGTFNSTNKQIAAVELDGAGIEHCVHHDALHQVRIVLLREIVAPLKWSVFGCEYGILIFLVNTITLLLWTIFSVEQSLMACTKRFDFIFISGC